mgnify:CR=1 FL=1
MIHKISPPSFGSKDAPCNLLDFQFYGYKIGDSETIYYNLPAEYKQVEYLELNDTEKLEINVKYDNNLIVLSEYF